jgi:hypothetical protein
MGINTPVMDILCHINVRSSIFAAYSIIYLHNLWSMFHQVIFTYHINPFVTSGTRMSHLQKSFQVCWDNSIPFFLHAAIYLEVSLFRWTSQNAFIRKTAVYKWYCVQCCLTSQNAVSRETTVYTWYCVQCCIAALHTVSFVHGCFMGKCILTGSTE